MLDDTVEAGTDFEALDKALQGGFRQGEFTAFYIRCRGSRVGPLEHGSRLLSDALYKNYAHLTGVDSDDFPS